ncbi:alpha/beta fold hydrolase [Streptomyces sp. NPDC090499]|uniref:alpha/beta fold hydrolase n=1 Tax=unclassified Streptomyces TaxID=2593676 RepID=UPI0037F1E62D
MTPAAPAVHHRTATVDGLEVFYREAGDPQAPVVVLLHGFPTSSHMFRNLIPALADRYRVIAPDHIGFGQSAMPGPGDFPYTFDALTDVTAGLLRQLGADRFAMYVQDYGAPIGWRLALRAPDRVTAIITQNGNAYEEGFVKPFWDGVFAYTGNPGPETESAMRGALTLESTRWQYVNGVADPSLVSPDNWVHDQALLDRPGNDEIQLGLFRDYPTNVDLYPRVHQYFRDSQVPLLAVWGANDEIFGPAGAEAFRQDLPDAEIHLVDSGHFALESHLGVITEHIRDFLARVLA